MFRVIMMCLMLAAGTGKEGDLYYVNSQGEEILVQEGNVELNTVPATVDDEYWKEVMYNEGN